MIGEGQTVCPKCGGKLKYYDSVKRILRTKMGEKKKIIMWRLKCESCRSVHRVYPDFILPYKQYEADIIKGVLDGIITPDTLGFEDYPCETTMKRWLKEKDDSE